MDRRHDLPRLGSLWRQRSGNSSAEVEEGAGGRETPVARTLSKLGSQCMQALPRMRSGTYARVAGDTEAVPLMEIPDSRKSAGGDAISPRPRTEPLRHATPSGRVRPAAGGPAGGGQSGKGQGAGSGKPGSRIAKFRNHYLRLADLEEISEEQTGNRRESGRGAPTCSTVKHMLAAAGRNATQGGGPNSRAPGQPGAGPPPSYFCRVLEQELKRVLLFAESFAEELWVRLGALFEAMEALAADVKSNPDTAIPTGRVQELSKHGDLIGV
ncbi:unnamed protein product [Ostreobium quekettii]|uniref:Uncharacterized protein n=1 Tax=Ostreobium quekettii TaxID=121088 RepID=A0A8S1J2T3_9CHLO|nr:unnamed protein product [Ostreobium quekettii]